MKKVGRPLKATSALVPAAARAVDTLSDDETELNAQAIDTFLAVVGGRQQLTDVLAVAASGSDIDRVASYLLDPRYQSWSLRRLCTLAGITVADLLLAYRKALLTRAHIEATAIIAAKLPPIVDDVMTRAAPQRQVCPSCQGASTPVTAPCLVCNATGVIHTEPDLDRQKLALELGQLTEKKGGIVMQQNTLTAALSAGGATGSGSLEQLQQAVGDLLFAPGRQRRRPSAPPPAEAEILGDPPEGHHSLGDPPGEYEPPLPFDEPSDPDDDDADAEDVQPDA